MIVGPAGKARLRLDRLARRRRVAAQPPSAAAIVSGLRDKAIQTEMVALRAFSSSSGKYSSIAAVQPLARGEIGDHRLQVEIAVGDVEQDDAVGLQRPAVDLRAPRW